METDTWYVAGLRPSVGIQIRLPCVVATMGTSLKRRTVTFADSGFRVVPGAIISPGANERLIAGILNMEDSNSEPEHGGSRHLYL